MALTTDEPASGAKPPDDSAMALTTDDPASAAQNQIVEETMPTTTNDQPDSGAETPGIAEPVAVKKCADPIQHTMTQKVEPADDLAMLQGTLSGSAADAQATRRTRVAGAAKDDIVTCEGTDVKDG